MAAGKIDGDLRALAELAGDCDCPAGLVRKTVSLRKTEAGAFSGGFGRKKWLKYSCQQLRRNAGSGIGNGKRNKFTFNSFYGLGAA